MKILIIVGMPGSGKTTCANIARRMNIFTLTTGDVIRDEIKRRGLEYNEQNDLKVARWFNENGREKLIARRLAEMIRNAGNPKKIVIEGFRSMQGINELKKILKEKDVTILAIHSSPNIRYEREKKRPRFKGKGYRMIKMRDRQEIKHGLAEIIAMSDDIIVNNKSLKEFNITVKDKLIKILNIYEKR